MKRITLLVASVLTLVGMSSLAHAKPSVAVLGLEVIDNGAVDKKATQAAQDLAAELRSQAGRANGKFGLAPNSAKDLLELKLLSGCGNEGRTCMAAIGKDLNADRLLYGKLELQKNGYLISLKLLNTNTKQMEKTTSELIPVRDLHSGKKTRWARALYSRLIGVPESGTLRIDANVDKATIYIDGNVSTTLRDGSAKVVGLEQGVHAVAVEAEGYKRYESDVSIMAGETERLSLSLPKLKSTGGGGGDDEGSGDLWKYSFYAGALATAGAGASWYYFGQQAGYFGPSELTRAKESTWGVLQNDDTMGASEAVGRIKGTQTGDVINGSCDSAENEDSANIPSLKAFKSACADGKSAALWSTGMGVATGVFALATGYFGYRAFFASGNNKERELSKRKSKRKSKIVVMPQVSPRSIGAGLALEF